MRISLIAVFLASMAVAAHAQSDQQLDEIKRMHWKPASNVHLAASKSTIRSLPGFNLIEGLEAARFREIVDGNRPTELEADALNFQTKSEVNFEWHAQGFIKSDDWNDVDADSFLKQLQENDEPANRERRARGMSTLHTIGWRQIPRLNEDTHTVFWSILAQDSDGGHVVNAVALKMGRYGFERIVWIMDPDDMNDKNDLLLAINAHNYDDGARYIDYVPGTDHAAAYGVAGLVAGALGVKVLKVAGAGALLIGLKKFGLLLVLPFIYVGRKVAGLFKRKPSLPT